MTWIQVVPIHVPNILLHLLRLYSARLLVHWETNVVNSLVRTVIYTLALVNPFTVPRLLFDQWSGPDYQAVLTSEAAQTELTAVVVGFCNVRNILCSDIRSLVVLLFFRCTNLMGSLLRCGVSWVAKLRSQWQMIHTDTCLQYWLKDVFP